MLEFGKREFARPESERWGLIFLESVIPEAEKTGFALSLLGTLAEFGNVEFEEFEFGIRKVEKRELIWL